MLIGLIDTEGGPCLLADAAAAMSWRGSDRDGTDYGQIFALDGASGEIRVGRTQGVVWDTQGAGTAEVHRVADGTVVLQRAWGEDVEPPVAAPGGTAVGTLDIRSGALVVLWSALAWSDLWEPRVTDDQQLASPTLARAGVAARLWNGRYRCIADADRQGVRCWVRPT